MRVVGGAMAIDVGDLLTELNFSVAEGSIRGAWLLSAPNGEHFEVAPETIASRLNLRTIRNIMARQNVRIRPLLIANSATTAVIEQAQAGKFDLLTVEPLQLIHADRTYAIQENPPLGLPTSTPHRPAWIRWAVMRYLLLSQAPARQADIATTLHTSQQAVSQAIRYLGSLTANSGDGAYATDRRALLKLWMDKYAGPGGHEFGWYSLDPITEQVARSVEVAEMFDTHPLVSSDLAADTIAPWKLPTKGKIYLRGPVDLAEDGFVPAPLAEATLVICEPQDATLWHLKKLHNTNATRKILPLVDPLIVLWDLLHEEEVDNEAAAEKIAELIVEGNL